MNQDEQEILINELEKDIDRLHALYNQYFMGIEKLEPTVVRKNLDRKINLLRREQIKNTALRFRMQMQIQKYNTQSTYWTRTCRQIENGTYTRHVVLAKKRIDARHGDSTPSLPAGDADSLLNQIGLSDSMTGQFEIDLDSFSIDLDDPFAELNPKKKAPPVPKPSEQPPQKAGPPIPKVSSAKPPPPPPTKKNDTAASLSADQAQSLYRRYLAARKKCNEPVDNISFDNMAKSLNAKMKSEGGNVDFKVVIRAGKAVIKTVKSDGQAEK
jgi:hypothetical protein